MVDIWQGLSLGKNGKIQFLSESPEIIGKRCYIRPEKVFFEKKQTQKGPLNRLQGTLTGMNFFGSYTRYEIKLADSTFFKLSLQNRKEKQRRYSIGDSVSVLFAVSDVLQFDEN